MSVTTRLLTAVSTADSIFRRNIHVTTFRRVLKTFLMAETPFRRMLFGNLRNSATVPEALFSTYLNLLDETASPQIHSEFNRTIMEPFLRSCHIPNDSPGVCEPTSVGDSSRCVAATVNTNSAGNREIYGDDFNFRGSWQPKYQKAKQRYRAMRRWKRFGKEKLQAVKSEETFVLRVLSFNILAQNLLEAQDHLYRNHAKNALLWKHRKMLLLQEILEAQADVVCLQEVLDEHLIELVRPFEELGYLYVYKRRTNDKRDGLLLLYRSNIFDLLDSTRIEFFKPGIDLLNRDNVALVVKLALKDNPQTQVVIATTHLLYNPKRHDIKLGQTQLLMAELERIAFIENTSNSGPPKYHPVILTGDFNLQPYTGVYDFITKGSFEYAGKGRNLEPTEKQAHRLSNSLIPPRLLVTDNCQHFQILARRLRGRRRDQCVSGERLRNNENYASTGREQNEEKSEIDPNTTDCQNIEIIKGHHAQFSSGFLTHPFNMQSIYSHVNCHGESEVTTFQGQWVTVDYIFFSGIEPLEKYTLPTQRQCAALRSIPNFAVGSDHLCLGASFKLKRKR